MIFDAIGVPGKGTASQGLGVILLSGRKRPHNGAQAKYWVLWRGGGSALSGSASDRGHLPLDAAIVLALALPLRIQLDSSPFSVFAVDLAQKADCALHRKPCDFERDRISNFEATRGRPSTHPEATARPTRDRATERGGSARSRWMGRSPRCSERRLTRCCRARRAGAEPARSNGDGAGLASRPWPARRAHSQHLGRTGAVGSSHCSSVGHRAVVARGIVATNGLPQAVHFIRAERLKRRGTLS